VKGETADHHGAISRFPFDVSLLKTRLQHKRATQEKGSRELKKVTLKYLFSRMEWVKSER
jgi:hypothetical protein